MQKPKIRLYVPEPLAEGATLALNENQSHYLRHVMRVGMGDAIAAFNGQDGEWLTSVSAVEKKRVLLEAKKQLRPYTAGPDIWLAFAPIKMKTELVVEKAAELGASKILPVVTKHCVVKSVNLEKLTAHAIEAAEQCERLDVPSIEIQKDLAHMLGSWPKERTLLYADESGKSLPIHALLQSLQPGAYGVLIGPEGGFSSEELYMLSISPFAKGCSLGPRILRADTAAVAALACLQSQLGDWDQKPHFGAR